MKILGSFSTDPISIGEGETFELIIENQKLFRELIEDIKTQIAGEKGIIVLSSNDIPIPIRKNIELIETFALFDINTKSLLSKVYTSLETAALDEEHYIRSQELMANIEQYLNELGDILEFDLDYNKLSIDSIIKAVSPRLSMCYNSPLETIIDYMNLICSLDNNKLFVFVNIRSYFDDGEITRFVQTISAKGMMALIVESVERNKIDGTKKIVVDSDLCEI